MHDETFFILLGLLALAILVLGPVAFFLTLGARNQLREVRQKLVGFEGRLDHVLLQLDALKRAQSSESPETPPEQEGAASPAADSPVEPADDATPASAARTSDDDDRKDDRIAEASPKGGSEDSNWQWPGQKPPDADEGGKPPEIPAAAQSSRRPGLEERLGTRWTVWVGGVALAFGALLLVRYAIDQGFFGPGARVLMGLVLAILLVGMGERMRRREQSQQSDPPEDAAPSAAMAPPSIPAMLTAAGTVAAFGSLYAAHALYGFIGPAVAFIALGLTAVATMFAAALHGPMLAGIGLAAALGVPLLVTSNNASAWPVVMYLAVTAAAAYALARLRRWLWLAISAAVGAGIWVWLFLIGTGSVNGVSIYHAALVHLAVQSAMAIYVLAFEPYRNTDNDDGLPALLPTLVLAALTAISVFMLAAASGREFSTLWVMAAAVIAVMLGAAGILARQSIFAVIAAGLLIVCTLIVWPWAAGIAGGTAPWEFMDHYLIPKPVSASLFGAFAAIMSLGLAASTLWTVLRGPQLGLLPTSIFAGTAVLTPMLALLAVYMRYSADGHDMLFAALTLVLALAFATCAQVFRNGVKDHTPLAWDMGQGITASAAIAALAIGLTLALDGGTLTIALALAALGAAFVAVRLDIAALRWCVAGLGIVLALRFLWQPGIVVDLSPRPIFNWLLAGYGVPALCFGLAARMMRKAFGEDRPVQIAQAMTILFAAALVYFQIRHFIFGGDLLTPRSGMIEQGLFAISSFAFAIVLLRLDAGRASPIFRYGSYIFGIVSALISLFGLGFWHNPYVGIFSDHVAGGKFFNGLLLAYLLPGLMALLLGRMADGIRPRWYVMGARIVAMALIFAYLTLQVRRVFQGTAIGFYHNTSDGEWYTYSAVWLMLGIALLAYGLWRKSVEVRIASAIFIVLSVLKVFLLDLAELDGILRALSFIGLGGVLIGIGLVYQKYVFARPQPAAPT